MHREFRKLLEKAKGCSEHVVAVNVDIRGFSSFSKTVESSDVAMFIKRVYKKLIDKYFPNASFYKPAGDGLLIIVPYTEKSLKQLVTRCVRACFRVLKDFGSFCAKDPMINFEVPKKVGIGLSRGSACCLVSDGKILDYSGRALNLASRLMDLARPSGIVFDANFNIALLPNDLKRLFKKETVYIKGIAELKAMEIYCTKDYTRISQLSKQPIEEIKWNTKKDTLTLKKIRDFEPLFVYELPSKPLDSNKIKVKIDHPAVVRGRHKKGIWTSFSFPHFKYSLEAGKPLVSIEFDELADQLEEYGIKDNWSVEIKIIYPEK